MTDQRSTSKRFALQFSLRSLLLVTALVAAFFGGRVSMQPALTKRDDIIREHQIVREQQEQWDREAEALMGQARKGIAEADQIQWPHEETDLQRTMRRHSAGNGQFFLGPIPEAK